MPFAVRVVWREPRDHVSDCYFCMTDVTSVTAKNTKHINHPNVPSAMRPVLHSDKLKVPISTEDWSSDASDDYDQSTDEHKSTLQSDDEFFHTQSSYPRLINQYELVRDLNLSKLRRRIA